MKVYLNRQVVMGPWGGGNLFVRAFHEMAPKVKDVEVLFDETGNINPEVILLAGIANEGPGCISAEQAIMYKMYVKPDCKIVLRVNENDARKGTDDVDDMLIKVSAHIDGTVFVSKWLQEYFLARGWACAHQAVIYNGVQQSVFKPQPKLNNGKLNIVAHHWSDNRMKGADIYERIDQFVGEHPDKFAFTYIGRHKCDFKHTNVVRPLSGKPLGEELGKHDIYVSASRFDPGPNHIIEALACGLPTYVIRDGGGAVEFAGHDHSYRDWNDLESILLGHGGPMNTAFTPSPWQTCIQEYIDFLEATWQPGNASGFQSS
jgi:hypothetical protein